MFALVWRCWIRTKFALVADLQEAVRKRDFLKAAKLQALLDGSTLPQEKEEEASTPELEEDGMAFPSSGTNASSTSKTDSRLTVVSVKLQGEERFSSISIWSGEVGDCPEKGVKASRPCNRLHTAVNKAKSIIAKSESSEKDSLLRNLLVYDPVDVVLTEERLRLGVSLGPSLSFQSWLDKLPEFQRARSDTPHSPSLTTGEDTVSALPTGDGDVPRST